MDTPIVSPQSYTYYPGQAELPYFTFPLPTISNPYCVESARYIYAKDTATAASMKNSASNVVDATAKTITGTMDLYTGGSMTIEVYMCYSFSTSYCW